MCARALVKGFAHCICWAPLQEGASLLIKVGLTLWFDISDVRTVHSKLMSDRCLCILNHPSSWWYHSHSYVRGLVRQILLLLLLIWSEEGLFKVVLRDTCGCNSRARDLRNDRRLLVLYDLEGVLLLHPLDRADYAINQLQLITAPVIALWLLLLLLAFSGPLLKDAWRLLARQVCCCLHLLIIKFDGWLVIIVLS